MFEVTEQGKAEAAEVFKRSQRARRPGQEAGPDEAKGPVRYDGNAPVMNADDSADAEKGKAFTDHYEAPAVSGPRNSPAETHSAPPRGTDIPAQSAPSPSPPASESQGMDARRFGRGPLTDGRASYSPYGEGKAMVKMGGRPVIQSGSGPIVNTLRGKP